MVLTAQTEMLGFSTGIIDALVLVFSRYLQIESVVVFISRPVRAPARVGSDIGLAVFAPEMDEATFARLWNELDELPIAFNQWMSSTSTGWKTMCFGEVFSATTTACTGEWAANDAMGTRARRCESRLFSAISLSSFRRA